MRYIYTKEQAQYIDEYAIQSMGFPGLVLMEKASMAVAALISEQEAKDKTMVVVCGMGNNGGDGIGVARLLKQAGYSVAICPIGDPSTMKEQTKKQWELALACDVPVVKMEAISIGEVLIDALFGVGLTKEVTGHYYDVIALMNQTNGVIYGVDIPSGVHATTGKVLGIAVKADYTVTFGVHKQGMILYPGCEYAGKITVADIGLPQRSLAQIQDPACFYEKSDLSKIPQRVSYSNKGTYGKVLIIAGSETMEGACFFSAKAAYLMGVGLVKVLTTANNRQIILSQLPEVIVSDIGHLETEILWADVIVAGPGMGQSDSTDQIVKRLMNEHQKPVVFDGDGLKATKDELLGHNHIITPHLKELSRIFVDDLHGIQNDIIWAATEKAKRSDAIVVLKDARTVVSNGQEYFINVSGNNGMATGGTGDVLAGIIGGLLAMGLDPFEAAKLGVYVHGLAGDVAAMEKGKYSLLASDLFEGIVEVLKER